MLCLASTPHAAAQEIDEIFVTAARRAVDIDQLSLAIDTIERESLEQHHLLTEALAEATGVFLQQTTPGQGAAIVRGQKGSAVLHLVDGMRLNNALFRSAPTQYVALVPTAAVEQVEVLRGTPTSLYGSDAIGGVVQVVTRVPEFDAAGVRGDIRIIANSAEDARRVSGTIDAGDERLVTSFSAEYADVGDRRVGGGDTIRPSAFETKAARWLIAYDSDENTHYSLDVQFAEQPDTPRSDELVPGFGQNEPSSSEFSFRPNRRTFVHGRYRQESGWLDLDWNVDIAWQRIDDDRRTRDYLAPERLLEQNRSDLYGLTISGSRLTETGSWVAGLDLYHDEVSSARIVEDVTSGQRSATTPRFPDGSSMQLLSAYANATWAIGTRHALTLGGRLSDDRTRVPGATIHDTVLSGDVGWVANLDEHWQLVTNLGYGFRAPNVFDVGTLGNRPGNRFNIPNPDLESERVLHGDFGVRYRRAGIQFEAAVFAMRYRDRIVAVATGDVTPEGREVTQSVNASSATVRGVEASLSMRLAQNWSLDSNVTFTRGEQRLRGLENEPADRVPPLSGRLSLRFDPGSTWHVTAWTRFAGSQSRLSSRDSRDPRIDPNGTPGWADIGARVSWQPREAWELSLAIENVLDASYRAHGSGIDATGRNVEASLRRRF